MEKKKEVKKTPYINYYEVFGHYTPYGVEEQENYNKVHKKD